MRCLPYFAVSFAAGAGAGDGAGFAAAAKRTANIIFIRGVISDQSTRE
jgi:hypothetical protein